LSVGAWDDYGHRFVATAAYAGLEGEARMQVDRLLGGGLTAFVRASVWADRIQGERPETRPWHSVKIPLHADNYDEQRDCSRQDCIVTKLEHFVAVLKSDASVDQKGEALRFIIGLVADIHQPLNCVSGNDREARAISLAWDKRKTNLLEVWEHYVLVNALNQVSEVDAVGSVTDWCNESHEVAQRIAYNGLPAAGDPLSEDYMRTARRSALEQIAKAAARLAKLLNESLR
jgi:hypothetical protein